MRTDSIPEYAFIEVLKSNAVVRTIKQSEIGKQLLIAFLDPDTYSFRVILDANRNGKWDDGILESQVQPEEVLFFTKGVKVRANWEMEVTLVPDK